MKITLLCVLLLLSPMALALDYTIEINSPSQTALYEGDLSTTEFTATITNNAGICDIKCGWVTSTGQSDQGVKVEHGGFAKTFPYKVRAEGQNGVASYTITIACDRISALNCWSSPDSRSSPTYTFTYRYSGDGICTTGREMCAAYGSHLSASSDCVCGDAKECRPDSNRGADEKGCSTYCGNKVVEKQYETCSNCPEDVGKCDGVFCSAGRECEGRYCVHNRCSQLPYIIGDTYCDLPVGETCRNSGSDCACSTAQRCSSAGVCETYCGNGVCEEKERGICNADCSWCGDGVCEGTESCASCSDDCGVCKKATVEEELQRNSPPVQPKGETLSMSDSEVDSSTSQGWKNDLRVWIIIGVLVILLLLGVLFLYARKKGDLTLAVRRSPKARCPECKKKLNEATQKHCHHCGHKLSNE